MKMSGISKAVQRVANKNNPTKLIDVACVDNVALGSFEEREIEFESSIEITENARYECSCFL